MKHEANLDFCPVLATMIATQRTATRSGEIIERLGAVSTFNNLVILRNLCLQAKPSSSLEVGLAYGSSALTFARSHQEMSAARAQHVAIDPFQSGIWGDSGLCNLERAGLRGYVDFRAGMSCFELPKLLEKAARFDLIYIDGDHRYESVFIDAYFCSRLLGERGIMAFDDSSDPNISKVLRFIKRNCPGLEEIDLSPYRADLGKPLRYRAARLLSRSQMRAFRRVGEPGQAYPAKLKDF